MTLTELKYLMLLAEEKHFCHAAERGCISQPTLSVAIKKLEQELGVDLFERSRNNVQLTPIGEEVAHRARLILEQVEALKLHANKGRDQLLSPLRLGVILSVAPYLLPHLVTALLEVAPQLPLFVEENLTGRLRESLRNGQLDAAIVALPYTDTDVVTKILYSEPFVVVMRADHPLSASATVHPEQLAEHDLLLLGEGHCFRDQVLRLHPSLQDKANSRLNALTRGSSLETLKYMVAGGLGITVLPKSAVALSQQPVSGLVYRGFEALTPQRTIAIAWRASFPRPAVIDALVEAFQRCQFL